MKLVEGLPRPQRKIFMIVLLLLVLERAFALGIFACKVLYSPLTKILPQKRTIA